MKKVIVGIHGLKNKPSKNLLEAWWKQSMIEGLNAIGKYLKFPPFELVYWADAVYDKPLNGDITDKNDPYYIDEIYTPATKGFKNKTHNFRLKVTGFIVKQLKRIFLGNNLSLKNRAIAENIMQRYFRELYTYYKESCNNENCIPCKTNKIIIERVISVLKKYKNHEIFIIGHSMGSILAFDALCFEVPGIRIHTFVTIGSPLGLPFVMSKIASRQNSNKNGKAILQTPSSIERNWYNFSDVKDSVAMNYKLSFEFSQNDNGVKPVDLLVKNNYRMNKKENHHNAFGYLRTKAFSEVLSAFIEEEQPGLFRNAFKLIRSIFQKKNKL